MAQFTKHKYKNFLLQSTFSLQVHLPFKTFFLKISFNVTAWIQFLYNQY